MRILFVYFIAVGILVGIAPGPAFAGRESLRSRISFTKVLPGSSPEYTYIQVDAAGQGSYEGRALDKAPAPRALQLGDETTGRIFELAKRLNYFRNLRLSSKRRIANIGKKTLVYEGDEGTHQVVFNYTPDSTVRELVNLFEKIANAQRHIAVLEHAVKYDKLSLGRYLRRIQLDLENKAMADPQLLVPALREIASNPRLLNLAQTRAQSLLEKLENSKK